MAPGTTGPVRLTTSSGTAAARCGTPPPRCLTPQGGSLTCTFIINLAWSSPTSLSQAGAD
eukprot:1600934-Pyramimonas_sp.AAC.2